VSLAPNPFARQGAIESCRAINSYNLSNTAVPDVGTAQNLRAAEGGLAVFLSGNNARMAETGATDLLHYGISVQLGQSPDPGPIRADLFLIKDICSRLGVSSTSKGANTTAAGETSSTTAATGGPVSPAAYVHSVCAAATSWREAIRSAGDKLSAGVNTKSLAKAKSEYVAFVGSLVTATGQAASQLKAAGSPSVSNGNQISGSLVRTFTVADGTLAQAASQAAALPTTSSGAFEAAASRVVTIIRGSLAGMSSVSPEKNPELHAAAANDTTCQQLAAAGSPSP
jgi:hypothetical protein